MNFQFFSSELQIALTIAREAAELAEAVRLELARPSMIKTDRSPVTVADFAVQALVSARLEKEIPQDSLVGEEDTAELRKSENSFVFEQVQKYLRPFLPEADLQAIYAWIDRGGGAAKGRYWVLDPVDGTKGFLRGEQYAVALALIENGVVKLGVLACPNLKESRSADVGGPGTLAFAEKGKGAWHTPLRLSFPHASQPPSFPHASQPPSFPHASQPPSFPHAFRRESQADFHPLKVSSCAALSQAVLLRSSDESHMNVEKTENLLKTLNVTKPPVEMSSLAKHAVLAAGGADFFLRLLPPKNPGYREKIWDQAPGLVIIQEAGGLLTDSEGKALDFNHGRELTENRGLLGANPHLHPQILSALRKISM